MTAEDREDANHSAAPSPWPGESPIPVRTKWIRARLRVPELERLLSGPIGARIEDNFDSLRVRLQKAVDRIGEEAAGTEGEIRRRAALYCLVTLGSLAVFVAAMTAMVRLSFHWLPAFVIGVAGAILAKIFAALRAGLLRDLKAVEALRSRFRDQLGLARTPEDLHRLAEKIRADVETVRGDG